MPDDARAFLEKLYLEKYGQLLTLAKKHLRDSDSAEEIVQDTFVSAQLCIDRIMVSQNPGGWLYRALMYKIKHNISARQRFIKLQMELAQGLAAECHKTEAEDSRLSLLDRLAVDEYKLLIMIYSDGYKIREAAAELGIDFEACRKRVHRARDKLLKNSE